MSRSHNGQLYSDIIVEIFKLNGLLVNVGDQLTKPFGLSSARWKILGALENTAQPMTVSEIAHRMGQTRQSVQRISDLLVTEGILDYQNNPRHKTAKLLVLTAKGHTLYEKLDTHYSEWITKIAENASTDKLEATLNTLYSISSQLEKKKC